MSPLRTLIRFLAAAVALLPLLAPTVLRAQALPAGTTFVTRVEGISEYRLANGLQVLLAPDDSKPTTTVNLTYHVGSRQENYGETGMAHLLEHLMFKGTPTTRNVQGELARRGLRYNGTTSYDRTNYFASFAANDDNLRWYLSWQADAMVHSRIAREDLDSEMTVVRNELEMGQNNPFRSLLQQVMASMYRWHAYGKSTIGARSDVENVDISRLQAFYRNYYQPDNATLVVSGRFDPAAALALVAKDFGPIPKPTRVIQRTYTVEQPQDGEKDVTVRRVGGTPLLIAGWQVMPGAHPDHVAIDAIASVLGDVPSGRLHRRLVQRQLAASVFAYAWSLAEPGPMFVGAQLAPGQDPQRARAELLATVDALATEPITAEELERARTQWLNDWDKGFNDPERLGIALSEAIGNGDWRLYFLDRDRMKALTLADVNRVASTWLVPDNRTVGVYLPTDNPRRAPAPALVDPAAMLAGYQGRSEVAQAEAFDATPANLQARRQTFDLPSGLKVALVPKATRGNAVEARLQLRYGDEASLRGQATAARLLGTMIDKGGAGMTRAQIGDAFDRLQAQVSFSSSGQALEVSISTVRDRLPEVVTLVGRLLRAPDLPADAFDEVRREALSRLASQRTQPGALASLALERHFNAYPADDIRYVASFDEQQQRLEAVTAAQLRAFYRRFVSAATGEFGAAGAIDPAALTTALTQAFGDWSQPADGPLPYARVPQPLVDAAPLRELIPTPDKPNAQLMFVQALALRDTDLDYPAMLLVNQMLGGSASSRLFVRIREHEGLSYGVGTFARWGSLDANSRLYGYAIFAPQNQPRVEAALREEVQRALREGFSAAELDAARTGLLNARRLARAQDSGIASRLVSQLWLDRDFMIEQRVDDAIAALSVDQVNAALRRYVDTARWTAIWAGDFAR
jgi:zinc protease